MTPDQFDALYNILWWNGVALWAALIVLINK
jgi:hypothetical protein